MTKVWLIIAQIGNLTKDNDVYLIRTFFFCFSEMDQARDWDKLLQNIPSLVPIIILITSLPVSGYWTGSPNNNKNSFPPISSFILFFLLLPAGPFREGSILSLAFLTNKQKRRFNLLNPPAWEREKRVCVLPTTIATTNNNYISNFNNKSTTWKHTLTHTYTSKRFKSARFRGKKKKKSACSSKKEGVRKSE